MLVQLQSKVWRALNFQTTIWKTEDDLFVKFENETGVLS